jgi:hypothetical protein
MGSLDLERSEDLKIAKQSAVLGCIRGCLLAVYRIKLKTDSGNRRASVRRWLTFEPVGLSTFMWAEKLSIGGSEGELKGGRGGKTCLEKI